MTRAAWIMLAITWSVIAFFTGRFFLKVLRTPPFPHRTDDAED
jgi:hypothetical protein